MKFLSRKFIVAILTAIVNILIANGSVPPYAQDILAKVTTGIGALYITIEGIADIVSRAKDN